MKNKTIVFFDGACGLCHGFVQFLAKRDALQQFQYAPMQGETAQKSLPPAVIERMDTIVILKNGTLYYRSAAVLECLKELPYWGWTSIGQELPVQWRDWLYLQVSKRRKQWFGTHKSCDRLIAKGIMILP